MPTVVSNEKARLLRSYHEQVLVLPNAWDAASAAVVARAGAKAVGMTSAGVAWSLGYPDGERVTRDEMMAAVERVARTVPIPVTADVERGYGTRPEDVAATVEAVIAAGAVGINLEDSRPADGSLITTADQVLRIEAAVEAAESAGVPDLVLNARTDVFLAAVGDGPSRLEEVQSRAAAYAAAGAASVFVPGLLELDALRRIVAASPVPVNAMAAPGGPDVEDLVAVGVRRISVGGGLGQVAYTAAHRAARTILEEGTFDPLGDVLTFGELDSMFDAEPRP